jgi:protein-L-isoaspartate(D-aspartate) O-methyltransferase
VSDLARAARATGVTEPKVLAALAAVPRAAYVPAHRVAEADRDRPIPIAGG